MSQINVTPMVDVMLVLLIIFMVAAPMMQAGIEVDLPKVEAAAIESPDEPLIITIDRKKRVFLGKKAMTQRELRKKLRAINKARSGRTVLLRADEKVPYGVVVSTISSIRRAGIEKIGMITEPLGDR
jgi:biopolymer transport protein TolR